MLTVAVDEVGDRPKDFLIHPIKSAMSKLFIGYVYTTRRGGNVLNASSGLAWHTDDDTLRSKFSEFGNIEEAVSGQRVSKQRQR